MSLDCYWVVFCQSVGFPFDSQKTSRLLAEGSTATEELATFLKGGQSKEIEIFPVTLGFQLALNCLLVQSLSVGWTFTEAWLRDPGDLEWYYIFAIVSSIGLPLAFAVCGLFSQIAKQLLQDISQLPKQLGSFSVRDSKCFCCSTDHCHPITGDEILCDRRLVYSTISAWYSISEEDDPLCIFDARVRTQLADVVRRQLGPGHLPWSYLCYMVGSSVLFGAPVFYSSRGFGYMIMDVTKMPLSVILASLCAMRVWLIIISRCPCLAASRTFTWLLPLAFMWYPIAFLLVWHAVLLFMKGSVVPMTVVYFAMLSLGVGITAALNRCKCRSGG